MILTKQLCHDIIHTCYKVRQFEFEYLKAVQSLNRTVTFGLGNVICDCLELSQESVKCRHLVEHVAKSIEVFAMLRSTVMPVPSPWAIPMMDATADKMVRGSIAVGCKG